MDLDLTLLIQLALLTALLGLLRRSLFVPLLRLFEARLAQTVGLHQEVVRLDRLTAADRQAYGEKWQAAQRQAAIDRAGLRASGRAEARKIMDAARAQAAAAQAQTRQQVRAQKDAAAAALAGRLQPLTDLLVQRLSGAKKAS